MRLTARTSIGLVADRHRNPMTRSLGRGKALPLLTPRRPVPDKIQLPTPSITPKISLKVGKRTIQVKSTIKAASISKENMMERDVKAPYLVSCSLDVFLPSIC